MAIMQVNQIENCTLVSVAYVLRTKVEVCPFVAPSIYPSPRLTPHYHPIVYHLELTNYPIRTSFGSMSMQLEVQHLDLM